MSTAIIVSRSARQAVEDHEANQARAESFGLDDAPPTKKSSPRLRPDELVELEYLWGSATAEMGVRSVHGAIEDRLRRAKPRDGIRRRILEELDRHEGHAIEGALVCVLLAEGGCTRYELRRAIRMLLAHGKIERRELAGVVECKPQPKRAKAEPDAVFVKPEWSGYELVLVGAKARAQAKKDEAKRARGDLTMNLALRSSGMTEEARHEARRDRWRRQDEALERECHMIECKDSPGAPDIDAEQMLSPLALARIERAMRALSKIPPLHRKVLRAIYGSGPRGPWEDEWRLVAEHTAFVRDVLQGAGSVGAAMRQKLGDELWLGRVKREAEQLIDEACREFRAARKAAK